MLKDYLLYEENEQFIRGKADKIYDEDEINFYIKRYLKGKSKFDILPLDKSEIVNTFIITFVLSLFICTLFVIMIRNLFESLFVLQNPDGVFWVLLGLIGLIIFGAILLFPSFIFGVQLFTFFNIYKSPRKIYYYIIKEGTIAKGRILEITQEEDIYFIKYKFIKERGVVEVEEVSDIYISKEINKLKDGKIVYILHTSAINIIL